MMDLKEIIKWFIPCFHILLVMMNRNSRLTFVCLFLLFNSCPSFAATESGRIIQVQTKNVGNSETLVNPSDIISKKELDGPQDISEGRTFGRPFKKMMAGFLPIIFQLGAASTWAVVAALVGVKTLAVTLLILKILLIAGAVKIGALFGQKGNAHGWESQHHAWEPPHHGWEPPHPQKEIHLHIHNGQPNAEHTAYSGWSRNDATVNPTNLESKTINVVYEPLPEGPQTISTPYGNYVKVQSPLTATKRK